jgi:general stress protein 26
MPVTLHHKRDDATAFLKTHSVGVLATVDPEGNPHAAAIYYAVDNHQNVSFLTKVGTKKADNLRHHNHAVLVVYDAKTQTTVQVTGTTAEIADQLELNRLFEHVISASQHTSGAKVMPLTKLNAGDYVGYKLTPVQVRTAVFTHSSSGGYEDIFATTVPQS